MTSPAWSVRACAAGGYLAGMSVRRCDSLLSQVQHMLGHELQQAVDQQAEGDVQVEYDVDNPPGPFMPAHKICSKCKAIKPSNQFFRDKSKPDGLYSQVTACLTRV